MKFIAALALAACLLGCNSGEKKVALQDSKDKVSYTIGVSIGKNLSRDSIALNYDALMQGLKDSGLDTSKRLLTEAQMEETMTNFQKEMRAKAEDAAKVKGEKNKADAEKFFAENRTKEGVKELPGGLQYKVLQEGNGPIPKESQVVTTNYRGTLLDGTEFDSSFKRGEPVTFPCKGVIPGWTLALTHMKVGSKWMIYVPSNLAYGEHGAGPTIGPNSALIFELELLSVK